VGQDGGLKTEKRVKEGVEEEEVEEHCRRRRR